MKKGSGEIIALLGLVVAILLLLGTAKFEWQLFAAVSVQANPVYEDEDVIIEPCFSQGFAECGGVYFAWYLNDEFLGGGKTDKCYCHNIGKLSPGEYTVSVCGVCSNDKWYTQYGSPFTGQTKTECDGKKSIYDISRDMSWAWITPQDCVNTGGMLKQSTLFVLARPTTTTTSTIIPTTSVITTTVPYTTTTIPSPPPPNLLLRLQQIIWSIIDWIKSIFGG